jgi:hydroxyacylglutathione hydrolase
MHQSLQKLKQLPGETLLFCGHEYTHRNLRFAHFIEPDNPLVKQRLKKVAEQVEKEIPTIPSSIEEEKRTNPFLRVNDPKLRSAIHMETASDLEVFTELRERLNLY